MKKLLTSDEISALVVTAEYAGVTGIAKGMYGRQMAWLRLEQPAVYPAIQRYLTDLDGAIQQGLGLFMTGGRGTGKTSTLAMIAEACRRTYLPRETRMLVYEDSNGTKRYSTSVVAWPTGCRYERMSSLAPFLSDFTYGQEANDARQQRITTLRETGMLLIDELGIGEFRNNGEALFFEIIEGRIEEGRPTCLAANGTIEQLIASASPVMIRLLDKLKPVSIPLAYAGESRRKAWGSSKQLRDTPPPADDDDRTWDQKIGD